MKKISKKLVLTLIVVVLTLVAGVIFFKFPILENSLGVKETLYVSFDSFLENELNLIIDKLEDFDPIYLVNVTSYLLLGAMVVSLVLLLINILLPIRILLSKLLNILVVLAVLVLVGFGVYGIVKLNIDYSDVIKLQPFAYAYYACGLLTSLLTLALLINKRSKKQK